MKLKALFEKIEHHVNRDDLIAIMDAFGKELTTADQHCFIKALCEALELHGFEVKESELFHEISMRSDIDGGHALHPDHARDALAARYNINVDYEYLTSTAAIKTALRKKLPVIISVHWFDPYYLVVRELRDGNKDNDDAFDHYRKMGATEEMVKKAINGIVPYPTKKLMDTTDKSDDLRHAILCVGYDAGDDAFIVRDYTSTDASFDGFFKIESKIFFDDRLKREGITIVEAAISVAAKAGDLRSPHYTLAA